MKKILSVFAIIFLVCAPVLAIVNNINENVADVYSTGDNLRGMINFTLKGTNLDSSFESNLGHSISLRTLLEVNNLQNSYNCSTPDCMPSYVINGEINSLNFAGGSKIIGFVLQGQQVSNIEKASLTIKSSSAPSCFLDLGVDVLNDDQNLIASSAYIDSECYAPRYGCFETNRSDYTTVTMQPNINYCEKITLPVSPAFRLGTTLVKSTQGSPTLKMGLYNLDGSLLKECTLPQMTQNSQQIECLVPYSVAVQQDYFVCLSALGPSNYKIRAETNDACGTNDFGSSYPGDYEIYAKNLQFDSPKIDVSSSTFLNLTNLNLDDYISSYISDRYSGICTPYCVVPIEIFGSPQNLQFSNAYIKYMTTLGQIESNSVYDVSQGTVSVNSGPIIIDINKANFTIAEGTKSKTLRLTLDGQQIVSKKINITSGFSFGFNPQFSTFGTDTAFSIITNYNITSTKWNFGDGTNVVTSNGKSASHRYSQQGSFSVSVEATRKDGAVSTKSFSVTVGDAKTSANVSLKENQAHLNSIEQAISKMPLWAQNSVKEQLDFKEMNDSLKELGLRYAQASNDEEYASIVSDLITLNVPYNISTGVKGTLPLIVGSENIDASLIKDVSGAEVADDSALQGAIAGWMSDNTNAEISFSTYNAQYSDREEAFATVFNLRTKPKGSFSDKTYLVFPYSKTDLNFASDYKASDLGYGSYISLSDRDQTFEFMIFDSISPEQLGAYISPSVESLGDFSEETSICIQDNVCNRDAGEDSSNCRVDCRPWGKIILWIVVIVVIGFFAWLGLYIWYKNNYERSLFPNKQDLVNITTYINTSMRNGTSDKAMRKKLKDAGWTGEQITYAMKKAPKMKPQLHEDAKFIKRPEFR